MAIFCFGDVFGGEQVWWFSINLQTNKVTVIGQFFLFELEMQFCRFLGNFGLRPWPEFALVVRQQSLALLGDDQLFNRATVALIGYGRGQGCSHRKGTRPGDTMREGGVTLVIGCQKQVLLPIVPQLLLS
jgi:hypothetical protein